MVATRERNATATDEQAVRSPNKPKSKERRRPPITHGSSSGIENAGRAEGTGTSDESTPTLAEPVVSSCTHAEELSFADEVAACPEAAIALETLTVLSPLEHTLTPTMAESSPNSVLEDGAKPYSTIAGNELPESDMRPTGDAALIHEDRLKAAAEPREPTQKTNERSLQIHEMAAWQGYKPLSAWQPTGDLVTVAEALEMQALSLRVMASSSTAVSPSDVTTSCMLGGSSMALAEIDSFDPCPSDAQTTQQPKSSIQATFAGRKAERSDGLCKAYDYFHYWGFIRELAWSQSRQMKMHGSWRQQ